MSKWAEKGKLVGKTEWISRKLLKCWKSIGVNKG